MTPQEAYDTAREVVKDQLVFEGEVAAAEDAGDFIMGEAAAWLCDLDLMPDVRRAALRGLVAGAKDIGHELVYESEVALANAVAEEMSTAL